MKKRYVMVECNHCGSVDYFRPPNVDAQAKANGWIVQKGKHFCDPRCQERHRTAVRGLPLNVEYGT